MKNTSHILKRVFIFVLVAVSLIYFNKHRLHGFIMAFNKVDPTNLSEKLIDTQALTLTEDKQYATIDLDNTLKMEFVRINQGSFVMGSEIEIGDSDETPVREVSLTEGFYLGKYEVTQEQWQEIMGDNPSEFKGEKLPVDTVSWEDCQSFLTKLGEKTNLKIVLPTEAQWEFACRAGTTNSWSFGDTDEFIEEYSWIGSNSGNTTHNVGVKKPNAWGLYDMYGNVQEWCSDWYANPYAKGDITDPTGPKKGDSRVLRGGGWGEASNNIRSAYRNCNGPEGKHNGIGFRCVLLIE